MLNEFARPFREYAPQDDVPLTGYAGAMGAYAAVLAAAVFGVARKQRWEPGLGDVTLLGVGTHKLARIITKDFVTAPLRAPFTVRRREEGAGEVRDEPRGGVFRSSVGYLLTCPYCIGPWLGTGLSAALTLHPTPTRFVLRMLAAVTISDFLHLAYSRLNESRKAVLAERRPQGNRASAESRGVHCGEEHREPAR
jgi:hypothetical protein